MHNVYLLQPAHGNVFGGTEGYWLPYSVGCLWSFAVQNPVIKENFTLKELVFKRMSIDETIKNFDNPSVAAFSCYVWNYEYCKKLAKAIKEKWPKCLIVFGGPQVTKLPYEKSFFKKHPYVDTIVNGEGEPAFLDILLSLHHNNPIKKVSTFARMANLEYPSPYTSGIFDKIVNDNPEYYWQGVLETNRGCPYSCTFCDWGSLTYSKVLKFAEDRVLDELTWMANNRVAYLFIADANFGMLYERDKKFAQHIHQLQNTKGFPHVVIAQWAKNAKQKIIEIAKIFFSNDKNRGFTVSVQSMNDQVLDAIKRKNMEISDLKEMLEECFKNGIPAYTEMILGLPYETYETWKQNHGLILEAGQHNSLDVWLAQLLENSELNSYEQRTLHQIESIAVPKFVTGALVAEGDDIMEKEVVVKATKYMPLEDFIKSYLFSYITMTYHYSGITHVLSRFLRKHKNISYYDFYSRIENKIVNGPSTSLLTQEYYRMKTFIVSFLESGESIIPNRDGHSALWTSIHILFDNIDSTLEEICQIINEEFCELSPELYKELTSLQSDYLHHYGNSYPYTAEYQYNIYDYVFNNSDELNVPNTLEISYPFTHKNKHDYFEQLYFGRRREVSKNRINKVDNV
jgi:putative methyltransferase